MGDTWLVDVVQEALPSLVVLGSLDGSRVYAQAGMCRLAGERMIGGARFWVSYSGSGEPMTVTVAHSKPEEMRQITIDGLRQLAAVVVSTAEQAASGFRAPPPTTVR